MPPKRRPGGSSQLVAMAPTAAGRAELQQTKKPWNNAFTPVREGARPVGDNSGSPDSSSVTSPVFSVESGSSPSHTLSSAKGRDRAEIVVVEEVMEGPTDSKKPTKRDDDAQLDGSRLRQRALALRAQRLPLEPCSSTHNEVKPSVPAATYSSTSENFPRTARISSSNGTSAAKSSSRSEAVDLLYNAKSPTPLEAQSAVIITELLQESNAILAEKEALKERLLDLELKEQQRLQEPAPWRVSRSQSAAPASKPSSETDTRSADGVSAGPRATRSAPQHKVPLRAAARGGVERVANAKRLAARARQMRQTRSSPSGVSPRWRSVPPPSSPTPAAKTVGAPAATSSLSARAKELSAKFGNNDSGAQRSISIGSTSPGVSSPLGKPTARLTSGLSLKSRVESLQDARSSSVNGRRQAKGK